MHVTILGAGAVGGVVGALLHRTGLPVTLVARGAHLEKMRADGLYVMTPEWQAHLPIPVSDTVPPDTDIVLLAVKSHQTLAAIAHVPRHLPVCCLQNGIGNEPIIAALGHPTIGAMVWMPTVHLVPGEVRSHGTPGPGAIDIGAYSGEVTPWVENLRTVFELAGIESTIYADIMALKRTKLLTNIASAVQAVCGTVPEDLWRELMAEATAVFDAAGLPYLPIAALTNRGLGAAAINGIERPGGSTWQSVKRGLEPETRALHDAVAELASIHGVAIPLIHRLTNIVEDVVNAGSWAESDLLAALHDTGVYSRWDIRILKGLQAVRERPGMYVGDPNDGGALAMAREVIGNALDVHLAGRCTRLDVSVTPDRLIVSDNGPGMPADAMAIFVSQLHAGTADERPHVHLRRDMRGCGLAPVNALSESFSIASTWQGERTRIRYFKGEHVDTEVVETGTGTRVELTLDRTIITGPFDTACVRAQLEQLAALTTLELTLNDAPISASSLGEYVRTRAGLARAPDHVIEGRHADVQIEACIWFADAPQHWAFVNYAHIPDGAYLEQVRTMTSRPLVVGIHVHLDAPSFGNPVREWLTNPEAVTAVDALIGPVLRA